MLLKTLKRHWAAGHLVIPPRSAEDLGGFRHGALALPERCGPGLTRQAVDCKPCQPPQVLHGGRQVEGVGRFARVMRAQSRAGRHRKIRIDAADGPSR